MAELEFDPSPVQRKFLDAKERIVFFGGGAGGGKALKDGTPVLTSKGWVNIEDLKVGDSVLTPNNKITKVTGVFPQGIVETYRVTFQDGRNVDTCGDHLWSYRFSGRVKERVSTTKELLAVYKDKNCLVPLTQPLDYGEDNFDLHPYLVGCILGDGNISQKHCCLTSMDVDVVERLTSLGYTLKEWKDQNSGKAKTYGVHKVVSDFRSLGLMGTTSHTKFIPDCYLNSTKVSRTELLKGLMDTDGYITTDGKMYYYSSSKELAHNVQYLVRSLGGRATVSEKFVKYKGEKVLTYSVYINCRDGRDFFFTKRKKERARPKTGVEGNQITDIELLSPSEATCISIEDEDKLFITKDFIVTHNTWSILVDNLQGVHDPAYFSVFFRTTTTEIDKGLWPEAKLMYEPILKDKNGKWIGYARINEQNKTITFPSGARTAFAYLEYEKHADAWYGSELTKIYFDEFQFRTEYQFDILRSRNRSRAKVQKGIRCTLNPDPEHFVYEWIKPFLDENAEFPLTELGGKTRYYVIIEGVLHTSWDVDELRDKFGKNPQTYTYIPSLLTENTFLMDLDPEYKDNLDSMPEKKRKQLLLGSWALDEDSGMYFQRNWLRKATHVPTDALYARGWDTAAEIDDRARSLAYDWTVGVRMAKSRDGSFYICGMKRFQERPGARDNQIITIAERDGVDCHVVAPVDPGGHGKFAYEEFAKKCISEGFICKSDPMPTNKSKLSKYEPFSVACQNGLVYIVESTFEPEELEQFYRENEIFTGERSTRTIHDDIPDAAATTFNYLAKTRNIRVVKRNQNRSETLAKSVIEQKLLN